MENKLKYLIEISGGDDLIKKLNSVFDLFYLMYHFVNKHNLQF